MLGVPGLRNIPARVTAFGGRRVRLQHPQETLPRMVDAIRAQR
jgi:hypothetical protein